MLHELFRKHSISCNWLAATQVAMQLFETVIIALQLTHIMAKRKYKPLSSEESIENILYYRDCDHKRSTTETPVVIRAEALHERQQQECKMCCTMCCGDDCVDHQKGTCSQSQSFSNIDRNGGGLETMQKPMPRQPPGPIQPPLRPRKKKFKQPLLPPIGGRRDFGFTRESIKSLISQDQDIKKILKDLVKVTMQKVDLVAMINTRRNQVKSAEGGNSVNDEDVSEH